MLLTQMHVLPLTDYWLLTKIFDSCMLFGHRYHCCPMLHGTG